MYFVRAFAVWLLIIFAESVHGTLRQLFLMPLVGDFAARRIAFFIAVLLIFLIAYLFIGWINAPSVKSLLAVGLMWTILTASFEFGLGRLILNYSWERILEDYNAVRGGLMGFGLMLMIFEPWMAARLRMKIANRRKLRMEIG